MGAARPRRAVAGGRRKRARPAHVRRAVMRSRNAALAAPLLAATLKPPMAVADQQEKTFLDIMEANFSDFLKKVYTTMGRDSAEGVALHARAALVPEPQMSAYFHALFDLDASGALKNLKTPLLFVGSARTWSDTTSWAVVGKARGFDNPGSIRARRVANSGVQMYADQPDTLAAVIRQFEAAPLASN